MKKGVLVIVSLFLLNGVAISQVEDSPLPIPDSCLFVPNIITINCDWSDFHGDYIFKVYLLCELEEYHLEVLNQWGKLVFETNNPDDYWDASTYADSTYYFWRVSGSKSENATPDFFEKTGKVFLIK